MPDRPHHVPAAASRPALRSPAQPNRSRPSRVPPSLIAACYLPACLLGACNDPPAAPATPLPTTATAASSPTPAALWALADARSAVDDRGQPLLAATLAGPASAESRRAAALALGRLQDPSQADALIRALGDPDATVRANASLGLGALEDAAPPTVVTRLLGALAAESDPGNRGLLLWDLSRVADQQATSAIQDALASDDGSIRAAGCQALANLGLRGKVPPPTLISRAALRLTDDPDAAVRRACAYALGRAGPAESLPPELIPGLVQAASEDDPETRAFAVRALGRLPGPPGELLVERAQDPDWRVASQAFRALATLGKGAPYAAALARRLDRVLAPDLELVGPELHVFLVAMAPPQRVARATPVHDQAARALTATAALAPNRDHGLAHCGAASLVDLGRGWPSRLLSCGLGEISEEERQMAAAALLGTLEAAFPERAGRLRLLHEAGSVRVKIATLDAAASLGHAGLRLTLPWIEAALGSEDPGLISAAAAALAKMAPPAPAGPGDRAAGAPSAAGENGLPSSTVAALREAKAYLDAHPDAEAAQAWLDVLEAHRLSELVAAAVGLAGHPLEAVRAKALRVAAALGTEPGDGLESVRPAPAMSPPAAPALSADDLTAALALRTATLRTSRGPIALRLHPEAAPATVARFAGLARRGFYDGLTFHRVVPGFVVQGGDPRGDGYGGPGWTQRCEDNRLGYHRGTVGMALAGRDTGGSQFFITYGDQPHLNGRYTAFAEVVSGFDALENLQVGDRILGVTVE